MSIKEWLEQFLMAFMLTGLAIWSMSLLFTRWRR